jgi:hypothetical protein
MIPLARGLEAAARESIMWNTLKGTKRQQLETISLARDATLRPGRSVVHVDRGTAIVTQAGDPEDHVLSAGTEYRPAGRGLVVVWALEDAVVTLAPVGARVPVAAPAACAA